MIKIPMVKIGNLFITILFFILVTLTLASKTTGALVTLEVHSLGGLPIKQIAIGCECDIRVTLQVSDAQKPVPTCVLEDKDQHFKVIKTTPSYGIFAINGVKKHTYTTAFRVQACKSGIARLKALVGNEQSDLYAIPVRDPLPDTLTVPNCELVFDRTDIIVGETVAFVVRLYTHKPCNAKLRTTHALPDALAVTHLEGPYYSSTRQGTNDISCLEWHGYVTARQEGMYTLPSLLIQYNKPKAYFSLFNYAQPKKISTAPVQFTVGAVPTGLAGAPVRFIGKLISFTSNLEKTDLMQGQAITYTLTFEGKGATDELTAPHLCLPQELSCYTPHCTREQLKEGYTRVTWHYVLQARASGSLVLPAQEFTWFDTQERTCKQIRTDEYTLMVTPALDASAQEALEAPGAISDSESLHAQEQESKQDDLDSSIKNILALERAYPALAWRQFYLLLCLPFGLWLFNAGVLVITSGRGRRLYYYYTAYWRAYITLRQAQEKQQVWSIYPIFVRYIGDRLELDQVSTITYEYLCSYMHAWLTQEEYNQWCIFLQDSLYVSAYAPPTACNSKQMFIRAYEWLVRLRARK